jgi:Protein of unknown function (DUF1186)
MQLEEILSELENNTGKFPHLALEKAIEERSAIPAFLTSAAIAMTKPLSGLDFERFRHCMNHSSMSTGYFISSLSGISVLG